MAKKKLVNKLMGVQQTAKCLLLLPIMEVSNPLRFYRQPVALATSLYSGDPELTVGVLGNVLVWITGLKFPVLLSLRISVCVLYGASRRRFYSTAE